MFLWTGDDSSVFILSTDYKVFLSRSQDGLTPLHAASHEGHDRVLHLLIQAGASVEQESEVRWCQSRVSVL